MLCSRYSATVADVRRRLHGVDATGRLYVGADCAIEIWRRTPGRLSPAGLLSLPFVRPVARFVYDRFADAALCLESLEGPLVGTLRTLLYSRLRF